MRPDQCELAHTAGLLHDIGRFGLSDRVMERGPTLTEQDWQNIRRHPELGADLLRDLGIYGPVAEIVRAHHERWDGTGYPDGLRGEEIPLAARIFAVADTLDALTTDRPYRRGTRFARARDEIRSHAGSQFDPGVVAAFETIPDARFSELRDGLA